MAETDCTPRLLVLIKPCILFFPLGRPCVRSHFSHARLFATPWTIGSSVHGILQARVLEWIAKPSSSASSQPSCWTCVSCNAGAFFPAEPSGKPFYWVTVPQFNEKYPIDPFHSLTVSTVLEKNFIHFFGCLSGRKVKVSRVWLFATSIDYTVHGILQARILEWLAIAFSMGSSWPRNHTRVSFIAGVFFTSWTTREAEAKVTSLAPPPAFIVLPSSPQPPLPQEFMVLLYFPVQACSLCSGHFLPPPWVPSLHPLLMHTSLPSSLPLLQTHVLKTYLPPVSYAKHSKQQ